MNEFDNVQNGSHLINAASNVHAACTDIPNQASKAVNTTENRPWRPQDADREFVREGIRYRVRNATVSENAIFIPAKPKPTIQDDGQKLVAAYTRVSTKSTEQVSSIENQTRYYTEKIEKTPNWEMQKIYSDEGKSGTSMRKRTAFRQMLKDAADKKMDLILCASVSRFARNVSDCIEQVRELRTINPSHPVGVYFETENIYTLDPTCDNAFKMHAMLADWESENKSRRMILSYDQRICTGQYPVADLLGFRHTTDGNLSIVEDEAITVRFIFLAYISGYSCAQIAAVLTKKGRKTLHGRTVWNANMVRNIMNNERRWGDLNVRKTVVIDYVKGKTVRNTQLRDAAFVPGHHQGIVTPQIAKAAQFVASSRRKHRYGVPDIIVVDRGALKGFVSVCPAWEGVDNAALMAICRSVYTDAEYEQLAREAGVLSGEVHSTVLSMDFTGYEVPRGVSFLTRNLPSLTISADRLRCNHACHKRLGNERFVEMLYHPVLQMFVIRPSDEKNPGAICWKSDGGREICAFSARAFVGAIYEKMAWETMYQFRFRGLTRVRGANSLLLFFLDEPQILPGRKMRCINENDESVQYIPDKRKEACIVNKTDISESGISFPNVWERSHIGISLAIRQRRDRLANTLTEKDITQSGIVVDNPMIGSIPNREQTLGELDRLLESM